MFKDDIDYAQEVKIYSDPTKEERRRYSPSQFITSESHKMIGEPDEDHISTYYVKRNNNLTIRTSTTGWRASSARSKKVQNQAHQHALNSWHYNFARIASLSALHSGDDGGRRVERAGTFRFSCAVRRRAGVEFVGHGHISAAASRHPEV